MAAIGFKAVHGGRVSGVQRVTPDVLAAMEEMSHVAPAHNPPYIKAMRLLAEKLPEIPLVAAFETGFHADDPRPAAVLRRAATSGPRSCTSSGGAFTARAIATSPQRTAELLGRDDLRIISCHLGGSNSLCAIRGRQSVATTMGMSPQTGLPHNNRVGDFDPFAMPVIMQADGQVAGPSARHAGREAGLLGLSRRQRRRARSGRSGGARQRAGASWRSTCSSAEIRRHLGGMLVELGGADAIVFTGGIGENGVNIRAGVCAGLEELGIVLDADLNAKAKGEVRVSAESSRVQIWIVPTNEELVVARQTKHVLEAGLTTDK